MVQNTSVAMFPGENVKHTYAGSSTSTMHAQEENGALHKPLPTTTLSFAALVISMSCLVLRWYTSFRAQQRANEMQHTSRFPP